MEAIFNIKRELQEMQKKVEALSQKILATKQRADILFLQMSVLTETAAILRLTNDPIANYETLMRFIGLLDHEWQWWIGKENKSLSWWFSEINARIDPNFVDDVALKVRGTSKQEKIKKKCQYCGTIFMGGENFKFCSDYCGDAFRKKKYRRAHEN